MKEAFELGGLLEGIGANGIAFAYVEVLFPLFLGIMGVIYIIKHKNISAIIWGSTISLISFLFAGYVFISNVSKGENIGVYSLVSIYKKGLISKETFDKFTPKAIENDLRGRKAGAEIIQEEGQSL